jgi:hypothetical protein
MFDWYIAGPIGVVLLVAFVWWLNRTGRSQGRAEFDKGMKRAAQTWKEKQP